jgi:hypothetical protein
LGQPGITPGGSLRRHRSGSGATRRRRPAAGSTNVKAEGNRIILGDAPAATGSVGVSQRSGIADLDPVHLTAATSAVVVGYTAPGNGWCVHHAARIERRRTGRRHMYVCKAWISAGSFATC